MVSLRPPQYLPTSLNGSDIEIELAYNLAQTVLADEELLIAVSDLCGELDWSDPSLFSVADKVPDRHFTVFLH